MIDLEFWEAVLAGGVRLAVPLGLAATGELLGERAGVLNLGLEGVMATGAVGGVIGAAAFGPTVGLLAGAAVGALVGLLFALLTVRVGADELICGFALALGGSGAAIFLYRALYDAPPAIDPYRAVEVPGLSSVPFFGPVLFAQPLVIWLLPVAVLAVGLVLRVTRVGLEIRAAGDGPDAARARGVDVDRLRLTVSAVGGGLAGLGGAVLCVGLVGEFSDQIIGGRGFLALALVIAARWRPSLLLPAVLSIGALQALQLKVQATGSTPVPVEILQAVPFLVTLAVLAVGLGSSSAPRALGRLSQERHG
jgi:ABC-type uncharacterized transport system permease subunit